MATFIMLPDGVTGTNEWQNDGNEPATADHVDNNNGGTQYIYETANSHEVTFTMANPSVAESTIDTITSVQIHLTAAYTATSGVTRVVSYQTGGSISNGFTAHNILSGGSYQIYSGNVESYSTGTTNWTYSDLEDLQIKLDKIVNTASRTSVRVSYLYALVTYVEAVGYGNDVIGIDSGDIDEINGIATADISKVNGV